MAAQSFDEKNEQDFEDVTERINEALLKMASDSAIKTTVSSLAELAGVHRNTIRNREWPLSRIREIKAHRKFEAEERKKGDFSSPKPIDVLTDRLEKAQLETMYWFKKHNEVMKLYEASNESIKYLAKTRDEYKRQVEALKKDFDDLKAEYERVCDLLNTVRDK
ncbi:hypothetical protein FMN52_08410 [Marinobacter sp. BW6]|uniref:hypothetical protein n=1 Tax=Marinobacter sp. BW6 TaxID=2592624 RepID=UPI0011DE854A|nr:hypothetical protein [Marinobacter sp. BW6]TYC59508.1 hypothetical protein FMN52_08410 [Marinobacter sp. BW6]